MLGRIENVSELLRIIDGEKDVIFYGAGPICQSVLTYLKKEGKKQKVWCIAVEHMEVNKDHVEDVLVVPIHNLVHFASDATVIVTAREEHHADIVEVIKKYGFDSIEIISAGCVSLIENEIKDFEAVTNRELLQRIEKIRLDANEQNEICDVNSRAFKRFKNCNIGKEIAVVGTGPTLNQYVPMEGVLHIGLNGAWRRKDIPWEYYFAQDFDRRNIEHRDFVENVDCQYFIGRYRQSHVGAKYYEAPVSYSLMRDNIYPYFLDLVPSKEIYLDIAYHPVVCYGSISFCALHFALYTKPERIYLVGCDSVGIGQQHAYESKDKNLYFNPPSLLKVGYAKMKTYAEYYYPETEIVSINPVGLKGLFRDIYT